MGGHCCLRPIFVRLPEQSFIYLIKERENALEFKVFLKNVQVSMQ